MRPPGASVRRTAIAALSVLAAAGLVAGALSIKAADPDATAMATMIMKPADAAVRPQAATSPVTGVDAACLEATRKDAAEKAATRDREAALGREFTVLACGDILLARTPGKRAAEQGFRYLFEGVRDLVSAADVAFANLETPASYLGAPYPGKPPNVTFRADPATLFGVAWAGFDVLSLANNHMNDYGPRAVAETLDYLDLLGIERCGAGTDLEEARRPALVVRDGVRFAFLAYTEPMWSAIGAAGSPAGAAITRAELRLHGPIPEAAAPSNPDSPWNLDAGVAIARQADIVADIRNARETLDPDYVFVSLHWGDEHQNIPNGFQRALGRAAIDAGATAVLGHHPHVLQSMERYKDGIIIHSLGNFVFDMASERTYDTAAARLVLSDGRLRRVEVIPLVIARGSYAPARATGAEAAARLESMRRWSSRFGTTLDIDGAAGSVFF